MKIKFEMEQISERVMATKPNPILHSIAGGVALDNFIVMFDPTMYPSYARFLRDSIERKYNLPTKFACVSHYHSDHAFGLAAFKDIPIVSSTTYVKNIEKRKVKEWNSEAFEEWKKESPEEVELINEIEILTPSLCIEDKLTIRDGDLTVEFKACGGHTSCSTYAYVPSEKVLFAGDMIFSKQLPYAGDPSCDPEIWMEQLEHFLILDIEYIVPGHGLVCDKEGVKKYIEFFKAFKQETIETIQKGLSFKDIKQPDFYTTENDWLKSSNLEHWFDYYKNKIEV